jgi:hypothetical protein
VHRWLRGFHQDDGERPTNATVAFRGGDDGAGTADGEEMRRWRFGEAKPAMRCTRTQTKDTVLLLTSL